MTETKPAGLSPSGSRGLELVGPEATELAPKEGYERAELRAELPGEHGFECVFYGYLAHRIVHLRERVYVKVVAGGDEFRPSIAVEHCPNRELLAYQVPEGFAGGESAYGKGRRLEVTFVCYSPPGSGAAEEAVAEIRAALEKLREVATWPDGKRSWFGTRHGVGWSVAAVSGGLTPAYRPPDRVLSYRPNAPTPPPRSRRRPVAPSPKSEWERELERTEREMRRLEKQQRELERGYGWTF